jgi:hypothetical protein
MVAHMQQMIADKFTVVDDNEEREPSRVEIENAIEAEVDRINANPEILRKLMRSQRKRLDQILENRG